MRQLFLDSDGVLADFNIVADPIVGGDAREVKARLGEDAFWKIFEAVPNFFETLPLMPEAMKLYEGVKHLYPVILTGTPTAWAAPQKKAWAMKYFPHVTIVTCRSADKYKFMRPGDVIVDDYLKYRHLWEENGGTFVHFQSADQAIADVLDIYEADRRANT